jgi:hypothetical protein
MNGNSGRMKMPLFQIDGAQAGLSASCVADSWVARCNRGSQPGQLHESILLTSLVPICIAPSAQCLLAPRFSVGKRINMDLSAPEGGASREIFIGMPFMRLFWLRRRNDYRMTL